MGFTEKEVRYVADFASLNVPEDQEGIGALVSEMQRIISFADVLAEIDAEGIEPTNNAIPVENVFREDVVESPFDREELLANAPSKEAGCYAVPKVME